MKGRRWLWACVLVGGAAFAQSAGPLHTFVKPYPGSKAIEPPRPRDYDEVEFPLRPQAGKGGALEVIKLAGSAAFYAYYHPAGRSPLEVFKNYEEALVAAGFKTIYRCGPKDCASTKVFHLGYIPGGGNAHYLTAKLESGGATTHVAVHSTRELTSILVVEQKAMETGKVVVTAEAMTGGLSQDGHVALYGIYFDTDKATLKPESRPTLEQIAKLLTDKPKLNLFVVGHTDWVGSHKHNLELSQARAEAVVKELVKSFGIAPARLSAASVGPLAPVAANHTEAGRARNRRVELVERPE